MYRSKEVVKVGRVAYTVMTQKDVVPSEDYVFVLHSVARVINTLMTKKKKY